MNNVLKCVSVPLVLFTLVGSKLEPQAFGQIKQVAQSKPVQNAQLSEKEAIAAIKKLNGIVSEDRNNGLLVCLGTVGEKNLEVCMKHLKALTSLRTLWVNLNRGLGVEEVFMLKVTDGNLEHLKGLSNLQTLCLNDTTVTDAGLEHLKGMKNLKNLELSDTKVTSSGMRKIEEALPDIRFYNPQNMSR